jgi:hypothetical protein
MDELKSRTRYHWSAYSKSKDEHEALGRELNKREVVTDKDRGVLDAKQLEYEKYISKFNAYQDALRVVKEKIEEFKKEEKSRANDSNLKQFKI